VKKSKFHWWDDSGRGEWKVLGEENLSLFHIVHHKIHPDWDRKQAAAVRGCKLPEPL